MPRVVGRPPKVPRSNTSATGGDSDVSSSSSENSTKNPYSYTAPQWLLQEKQTPKFFTVPLPPVPNATRKAIQTFVQKHTPQKSRKQTNKMMQQLRQLQSDQKVHRQKVKDQKEKLSQMQAAKETGLDDIRKVREEEISEAMQELEDSLRSEHDKQFKEQEEQLKQKVKEDFEKDFEAEQSEKRKEREEEEEALEKASQQEAKKLKAEPDRTKSEAIGKKIEELQAKLDKLTETKSEMVWLLKQVIKAETKRKVQLMKQKKLEAAKNK